MGPGDTLAVLKKNVQRDNAGGVEHVLAESSDEAARLRDLYIARDIREAFTTHMRLVSAMDMPLSCALADRDVGIVLACPCDLDADFIEASRISMSDAHPVVDAVKEYVRGEGKMSRQAMHRALAFHSIPPRGTWVGCTDLDILANGHPGVPMSSLMGIIDGQVV